MNIYDIVSYTYTAYKHRDDIWTIINIAYYTGYIVIKYTNKSNKILPI